MSIVYGWIGQGVARPAGVSPVCQPVQFRPPRLASGGGSFNELGTHFMSNLTILSKEIRQLDGLYSLNDLHKASGGLAKHQPNRFIRLAQTQELIQEISKYPEMGILPVQQKRGVTGGTYVCKELVYAYAMWINAGFYLQVIGAYDKLTQIKPKQQPKALPTPKKYNYSRKLLEQDGFCTRSDPAKLNIFILSNKHYVSPLMHLLNELRTDGHEVSVAWDEAIAMREGILQANTALEEIYTKALRSCHKPASTAGNK